MPAVMRCQPDFRAPILHGPTVHPGTPDVPPKKHMRLPYPQATVDLVYFFLPLDYPLQ
jgi:hypothetical protein